MLGLVSSQGANRHSWLLYPQTKGQADHEVEELAFPVLHVYRPGMLGRGDKARTIERWFSFIGTLPVETLALAMVKNAQRALKGLQAQSTPATPEVRFFDNQEILRTASE